MRDRLPIEKVYLQLDKPYYSVGDTLHFKAYLMNGDFLRPSLRSGLLYVELDDAMNRSTKRIMVKIIGGIGWGDMVLNEEEISEGSYTIRAYTNWMRNFSEDNIFKRSIYISPVNGGATLVNADYKLDTTTEKGKIEANLRFTALNSNPKRLKDITLKVMNGRHTLSKYKATTGIDGTALLDFDLPDKNIIKDITIQAKQTDKDADTAILTIPVIIKNAANTDIQFMPEGGYLVAGINAKVGFKAIADDGKETPINGKVYNSKQQEVASFNATHKGMGAFEFTAQAGESYIAKVTLPGNISKSYPLPMVNPAGTILSIVSKDKESLEITLNATPGLLNAPETYYLIGQTRGMVCYSALINFNGAIIKKTIPKDQFPTGIAHFTLFSSNNEPLNERIIYIDHNDNLHINITTSKPKFTVRDSIAVYLEAKDKDGKPVRGTFSMAVTDDSQITNHRTDNNIISNLLLTSDLKGTVEEPGWYFETNTPDRAAALDNLLLTQGWVGYDWKLVFNPMVQQPQFPAESEFTVRGKVTNLFGKPSRQTVIRLLQKLPVLAIDTITNNDGRFTFKGNLYPTDTAYYLIQAKNKNGETFNVGIDVDEFIPPVFAEPKHRPMPWYFNSDTTLLNNANTKIAQHKAEADYKGEGHMLKEVVIKSKKIIPGSVNPFPAERVSIVLDEKDMNADKNMSLFELLKKRYGRNFYLGTIGPSSFPKPKVKDSINSGMTTPHPLTSTAYFLYTRLAMIIIDGHYAPPDVYMDYLTASEIKGIEVVYIPTLGKYDLADMFITTYSGKGPRFLHHTPGRYVYRPLGFSFPKEVYRPKYTEKNKDIAVGTDLRSTIHWAPNVVTDKDGKATVSFYSADKPADYTLILEGTDLKGAFGYGREKIKVIKK